LSAKSILIAGGGLIGAELAGDLAGYGKEKAEADGSTPPKITLINSKSQLCPELSESAATKVQRKLEGMGVTVILNDHAEESDGKMVLKSTGAELEAEQVVLTIGIQPINTFLDDSISGDILNERGWIVADEFCRVQGTDGKLFAFGDCCTRMPNSGNHLFANVDKIGNNLLVSLDDDSGNEKAGESKLMKVTPNPSMVCCTTVGPKDGVFSTWLFSTDWIVPGVKNSNMFFPYFKQAIEY
jgi:NADPH-dependent 2,4-dienoyl-CoA reductase/sulfur reductase-like enzyme